MTVVNRFNDSLNKPRTMKPDKKNEGVITVNLNEDGEVVIDEIVSYTPPKDARFFTDLTKVNVKGYEYSHKEETETGEVFIYNPISDEK